MKYSKCPYCNRKIPHSVVFKNKRKGIFVCENCDKESKIEIDKKINILFLVLCLLLILFIIFWYGIGLANNIFGVIIVSVVLLVFNYMSPKFINFIPLKKYDNNEENIDVEAIGSSDFVFNREAFDKIKKQKEMGMLDSQNFDVTNDIKSHSENMIPVIEDVKEGHISSFDGPLHKINRQPRKREFEVPEIDEDIKEYTPAKKKKKVGNKYTGNRKF